MASDSTIETIDRRILGTGWAFPVRLTGAGAVSLVDHEEDVRQAIRIIIETNHGERLMRPTFGSGVRAFVFETISTTTLSLLRHRVEEALVRWEPRIRVESVTVELPQNENGRPDIRIGKLEIRIEYMIRATNTFYNIVYPFYLDEAMGDVNIDVAGRREGIVA